MFGPLFERFTANTPLTVMTRALLENALRPEPLDELFERLAVQQYKRELLFSTVVDVMAVVACRIYKSPHAVRRGAGRELPTPWFLRLNRNVVFRQCCRPFQASVIDFHLFRRDSNLCRMGSGEAPDPWVHLPPGHSRRARENHLPAVEQPPVPLLLQRRPAPLDPVVLPGVRWI